MESYNKNIESVNIASNRTTRGRGSFSSANAHRSSYPPGSSSNSGGGGVSQGAWNPYAVSSRGAYNSAKSSFSGTLAFSSPQSTFPTNIGGSHGRSAPNSGISNSRTICQLCSRPGHLASRCYQRFNFEFPGVGAANMEKISANIATADTVSDSAWYPDSGATSHCTADQSVFAKKDPYFGTDQVHMGDGAGLQIQNVGFQANTDGGNP